MEIIQNKIYQIVLKLHSFRSRNKSTRFVGFLRKNQYLFDNVSKKEGKVLFIFYERS